MKNPKRVGDAIWKVFLSLGLMFLAIPSVFSEDFEDSLMTVVRMIESEKPTALNIEVIPAEYPKDSAQATSVGWNATWDDLYVNWGVDRQFLGQKLTVKLGFIRGAYDSYAQTYKAQPVVSLIHQYSGGCTVAPYLVVGRSQNFNLANSAGALDVTAMFDGRTLTISNYFNTGEQIQISYAELLEKWVAFASARYVYCSGKKYFMVPQSIWNGDAFHLGFSVSENASLYSTTNCPQDFVELYKETAGTTTYNPLAYSLPTRLAFLLPQNGMGNWSVRQMTAAEVGEALVARLRIDFPALVQDRKPIQLMRPAEKSVNFGEF